MLKGKQRLRFRPKVKATSRPGKDGHREGARSSNVQNVISSQEARRGESFESQDDQYDVPSLRASRESDGSTSELSSSHSQSQPSQDRSRRKRRRLVYRSGTPIDIPSCRQPEHATSSSSSSTSTGTMSQQQRPAVLTFPPLTVDDIQTAINNYISQRKPIPRKRKYEDNMSISEMKLEAEREVERAEAESEESDDSHESTGAVLVERDLAPQFTLVDGEIKLKESTLEYTPEDQSQNVSREESSEPVEVPKRKRLQWGETETALFYELLEQHGADFEKIAKGIPDRDREKVKRKFHKEYRMNPEKVEQCLLPPKEPNRNIM